MSRVVTVTSTSSTPSSDARRSAKKSTSNKVKEVHAKQRRSDLVKRPAVSRYNKVRVYQTKRPGGQPVKVRDGEKGEERVRPRRYRPITHTKRRRHYYTHNRKAQTGSTLVQARVNTFIKKAIDKITAEVAEAGTHWPATQPDGRPTHFQCTDAFKTIVGLYQAKLQEELYNAAACVANAKPKYKHGEDVFVQVHEHHVLAAWNLIVQTASKGRNTNAAQQFLELDKNGTKSDAGDNGDAGDADPKRFGRARYLSTGGQRNAIKALNGVSRMNEKTHNLIDSIVKEATEDAIELAMIRRSTQPNRVQLKRDDAIYAFNIMNIFPQVLAAL